MIKAISVGYNYEACTRQYQKYCSENNIPFKSKECVMLPATESLSRKQEKIQGLYNYVMRDEIKLLGLSKENFRNMYLL